MDNYIVSARKYRPATFQSVVGQKSLTTTLKNAIQNHKLAHAYLFCGPRGVGKTTCARIFAKTINCQHPTAGGEACNACESCKAFNENRSYNIYELDAASNNSVDDIRSLTDQVRIPPQIGQYKVYIIDEVHMLSTQAFNAFLKTLEEPPHHAVFILATTEKHKIIPTILSRCQIYDFSRITINDIVEHLKYVAQSENVAAEPEALNAIAQKADGGMRDALSIFDQVVSFSGGNVSYQSVIENLNVLDYEYYFRLTEALLAGDVSSTLLILNEILGKGFDGQQILSGLSNFFRDVLVSQDAQTLVLFEVGDAVKAKYQQIAQQCTPEFLYKALEWTNETDLSYRISKNKRLSIELLLIRLCQLNRHPTAVDDKKKITLEPLIPTTTAPIVTTPTPSTPPSLPTNSKMRISLKPQESQPQKTVEQAAIPTETLTENQPFTQADLTQVWQQYAAQETDIHVKNTILNSTPQKQDENRISIAVFNPAQEKELQDRVTEMQQFLAQHLHHSFLELDIHISENKQDFKPYTNKEKYEAMAEKNPAIITLVQEFSLQLN
ncbi:DNA polymerase III subunit gamma/tau [Bacteroidia bacterium]|nr:DNA polymerase III subunit gamma/tau [Bacteroidia bacterium]